MNEIELNNWIITQKSNNIPKEKIYQTLLDNKLEQTYIEQLLNKVYNIEPQQILNMQENQKEKINLKELFSGPKNPTQTQEKESKTNLIVLSITIILTIIILIYFFKFR